MTTTLQIVRGDSIAFVNLANRNQALALMEAIQASDPDAKFGLLVSAPGQHERREFRSRRERERPAGAR